MVFSCLILSSIESMTIKAPVRPTPALWLKREMNNCYIILFTANNIQMTHLWKCYLQCVIAGPASGVFIEMTLLRNWRNGAGCSGTPWSGQAVYWNCFTSRRSVYPIYFYWKRYKIIPNFCWNVSTFAERCIHRDIWVFVVAHHAINTNENTHWHETSKLCIYLIFINT